MGKEPPVIKLKQLGSSAGSDASLEHCSQIWKDYLKSWQEPHKSLYFVFFMESFIYVRVVVTIYVPMVSKSMSLAYSSLELQTKSSPASCGRPRVGTY